MITTKGLKPELPPEGMDYSVRYVGRGDATILELSYYDHIERCHALRYSALVDGFIHIMEERTPRQVFEKSPNMLGRKRDQAFEVFRRIEHDNLETSARFKEFSIAGDSWNCLYFDEPSQLIKVDGIDPEETKQPAPWPWPKEPASADFWDMYWARLQDSGVAGLVFRPEEKPRRKYLEGNFIISEVAKFGDRTAPVNVTGVESEVSVETEADRAMSFVRSMSK